MSESSDNQHLKSISDKLTWGVIFLFIIMLNTCSLSDDIEDAIRDRGGDPAPAADTSTTAPTVTGAVTASDPYAWSRRSDVQRIDATPTVAETAPIS